MKLNGVRIEDTYAEAFAMWAGRAVITGRNARWAREAATKMTGFATSVIGCKCEAGIERDVPANETADGREGTSVLLFAFDSEGVQKRLVERVGQCVLTCPTAACYDGLPEEPQRIAVGAQLRYFGDRFQISKVIDGRRYWRVPVMEGEFLVEDTFGVRSGVGGGNVLILGESAQTALNAAEAAVEAIAQVRDVILPFPGGIVRSGSKVGSRHYSLIATTNEAYCPTLRALVDTALPDEVNSVLEIVIDGLSVEAVAAAMRQAIRAACLPGIHSISAGNYGGKLGQYKLDLHQVVADGAP